MTLRQLIDCLQLAGLLREASFILSLVQPPYRHTDTTRTRQSSGRADADAGNQSSLDNGDSHIAFTELISWTKNFDDSPVHSGGCLLGTGGYADVFKGLLYSSYTILPSQIFS